MSEESMIKMHNRHIHEWMTFCLKLEKENKELRELVHDMIQLIEDVDGYLDDWFLNPSEFKEKLKKIGG